MPGTSRRADLVALQALQNAFELEIQTFVAAYEELATTRSYASSSDFSLETECLLEGILSRVWQSWNKFCRQVIVESCLGTQTLSGPVAATPPAVSEQAVSAASIRVKNKAAVVWQGTNSLLRREPTWGDVDSLLDIVNGLAPSNAATLLGLCTMATPAAKVLQAIRNAAAHQNQETMATLGTLSLTYSAFAITHPCQSLFWVDGTSGELLLLSAVENLKDAAVYCVL